MKPAYATAVVSAACLAFATTLLIFQHSNSQASEAESGGAVAVTAPTGTGSSARPKVEKDGDFRVEGIGYTLFYYFEEGRSFESPDAHVFYTPPFHLVVDNAKNVRYHIDDESKSLTLWVRRPTSSEEIENSLREELVGAAKKSDLENIDPKTHPYRLSPLTPNFAVFEISKGWVDTTTGTRIPLVSEQQKGIFEQGGAVAVDFYNIPSTAALKVVENLQRGVAQVSFKYEFGGISTETCTAQSTERGVQDLDIFKKLAGEGSVGTVARHQIARIADKVIERQVFTVDCANAKVGTQLLDLLLEQLDDREGEAREVAGWDEISELTAFDADSFKADLTEAVKEIEQRDIQTKVDEAFAAATTQASSEEYGGGLGLGWAGFGGSLEASFGETSSESEREARRAVTDALEKTGYTTEWKGRKLVPKSVDVHSVADLKSSWGRSTKFEFKVDNVGTGDGALRLTESDRTAVMPLAVRSELDERLEKLAASLRRVEDRLAGLPEHVPVGGIAMYFGDEVDLPENWMIANGQRVTDRASPLFGVTLPNLRKRFVRGAKSDLDVGKTGGQDSKEEHRHEIIVESHISGTSIAGAKTQDLLCIDNEDWGRCAGEKIDFSPLTDNAIIRSPKYDALVVSRGNNRVSHGHVVEITKSISTGEKNYEGSKYHRGNVPRYYSLHFIVRVK